MKKIIQEHSIRTDKDVETIKPLSVVKKITAMSDDEMVIFRYQVGIAYLELQGLERHIEYFIERDTVFWNWWFYEYKSMAAEWVQCWGGPEDALKSNPEQLAKSWHTRCKLPMITPKGDLQFRGLFLEFTLYPRAKHAWAKDTTYKVLHTRSTIR
jgi:hypothetical protein